MQRTRRGILAIVGIGLMWALSAPASANLETDMNQMFNDLGAIGNITQPGAFRGQAQNILVGGNLMMRSPAKNYQLLSWSAPSIRMGCGGIDAYGGSFSFINKSQLTAMFNNIMSNALGYFFKLALKSVCPDCEGGMQELFNQIKDTNLFNINSCQAAQALTNSVVGMWNSKLTEGCMGISDLLALNPDRQDARFDCTTDAPARTSNLYNDPDPNKRAMAPPTGNVVWKVLKEKTTGLSDDELELIMTFTGTVVFMPYVDGTTTPEVRTRPALIDSLRQLVKGHNQSSVPGKVKLTVYKCDTYNWDGCLDPTPVTTDITPFTELTKKWLMDGMAAIKARDDTGLTGTIKGFIDNTNIPVYKIMSIGATNDSLGISLIGQYNDLIAMDYVYTYMSRVLSDAIRQLAMAPQMDATEMKAVTKVVDEARAALQLLVAERSSVLLANASTIKVLEHLKMLERDMRATLPSQVRAMFEFASTIPQR
jgi:conjugative transfer pilus assembly protein TraH